MKKIFILCIFISACACLFAQNIEQEGDFRVRFPNEETGTGAGLTAIIVDYTGKGNSVTIPTILRGAQVEIAPDALKGKGLVSVDLSRIRVVGRGAFANNPLNIITISANINLDNQTFDNGFVAYYNSKGKAAGKYTYDTRLRRWLTDEDKRLIDEAERRRQAEEERAAAARRKAEEENAAAARRKAEEEKTAAAARQKAEEERRRREAQRREPPPSYSPSYDSGMDIDAGLLAGYNVSAGYSDILGYGLLLQAAIALNPDGGIELDITGYVDGGFSIGRLFSYGAGGAGELYFAGEFGLGFGMGFAGGLTSALTDVPNPIGYYRGSLLFRDSWGGEKVSLYADYFKNSNWRIGFSYLFPIE